MSLVMTVAVECKLVAQFLSSAFAFGGDVIYFNHIFFPEVEFAPATFSLLFLKQFSYGRSGERMVFEPFCPVQEVSVKWTRFPLHFRVALRGCYRVLYQFALLWSFWRRICPGIPFHSSPVFPFYPFHTFFGMPFEHLMPEGLKEQVVASLELLRGHHCSIVLCPALNNRVKLSDNLLLGK